jgi:hypothetical protein
MMSKWFWKKLSVYFGWMATIVLFALLVFAATVEIKDLDLWLHLASGRYIIENFRYLLGECVRQALGQP